MLRTAVLAAGLAGSTAHRCAGRRRADVVFWAARHIVATQIQAQVRARGARRSAGLRAWDVTHCIARVAVYRARPAAQLRFVAAKFAGVVVVHRADVRGGAAFFGGAGRPHDSHIARHGGLLGRVSEPVVTAQRPRRRTHERVVVGAAGCGHRAVKRKAQLRTSTHATGARATGKGGT